MDCSLAEFDVNVCGSWDRNEGAGFVVDWGSLYDFLTRLEDRRDPRGVRYPWRRSWPLCCWPNWPERIV